MGKIVLEIGKLYRRRDGACNYAGLRIGSMVHLFSKNEIITVLEYMGQIGDKIDNAHRWKILTTTGLVGTYTFPVHLKNKLWELLDDSSVTEKI